MRTRTLLTTPPGEQPTVEASRPRSAPERYVPALEPPREPSVPGRYRRLLIVTTVVVVVAVAGILVFRVATAGQSQDPALPAAGEAVGASPISADT